MDSEGIAKVLGALIAAVALVAAIVFGPIGQFGKAPVPKVEAPKAAAPVAPAAPAPRGPVVREVPQ